MDHVEHIAAAPHPIGSHEHLRARDYVLAELTALGASPALQRTLAITAKYQVAGNIENIVVRIHGASGTGEAVLLAAHYDSVPAGPGAGDDASGVATLLETLRALGAGPRLRNDVIFLFTDGEEDGLLGASAFVTEHPWAKDVRVALNFEARGTAGVSQLFETSAGNGSLVRAFAQSSPHPRGSSLSYEVYRRMPNDTDLTVLKTTGAAAMNFAFVGQWESYHTPLDNAAHLDRGTLQQHGENALSLARAFGNADLNALSAGDDVFFNVLGGTVIHYSQRASLAVVAVAALLWALAAAFALRSRAMRPLGLAIGFATQLSSLVLDGALALAFAAGIGG
ncbi:MAG TPA: M20/M25/M40 family metallo-hydrolase, partial [Polyangiaceae bacterium]